MYLGASFRLSGKIEAKMQFLVVQRQVCTVLRITLQPCPAIASPETTSLKFRKNSWLLIWLRVYLQALCNL